MSSSTATIDPRRRERVARVARFWGIRPGATAVCPGHAAPLDFLAAWVLERPPLSLVVGPRGGGKSYLRALATHLDALRRPGHATRILGGSLAQSGQIYEALRAFDRARPELAGRDAVTITKTRAVYGNGSEVGILAASATSVRGPHVPTLCLDEVDEIDAEIREAALGMCMASAGTPASVAMTSTWHKVGGPMTGLVERANDGAFPAWTFCAFEVLERCPEARSGPALEKCPECPLVPWCHADRDAHPSGLPKAKRSDGHYAIDSLIQKVRGVSALAFESDYLCRGPRAAGRWFLHFHQDLNVSSRVAFHPRLPVHLAVDPGVFTGAVFFQVHERPTPQGAFPVVHVLADYLGVDVGAEAAGRAIREIARTQFGDRIHKGTVDSSSSDRTATGPKVIDLLVRGGLPRLEPWPKYPGSLADSLAVVSSFILTADGSRDLLVHPRCVATIAALQNFRRAKVGGQWRDVPEDPQHPHEDLVEALRGGLLAAFPYRLTETRRLRGVTPHYLT